ncbi:MAG: MFS transporter, partial [Chloroflexi bacterium]|nr:MFS transporter [Chloroflexota bacterium]
LGDLLLIPLLERMNGLRYLTISAVLEAIIFSAFLLVDNLIGKFVLLGLLGFFNAGWYSILQGQLYTSMRGQSGTVLAVNNISGLVTSAIPFTLGLIASVYGLETMMWVMLLGPAALLIGLRVKVPEEVPQYVS